METRESHGKKMKQLDQIGKTRAIAWAQEDVSQAEIARRLHVSKSTIYRLLRRSKNGTIPERKKGSGPPRKVSKESLKVIKQSIKKNPMLTSNQIKLMNKKQLRNISTRTIRRYLLEELNLRCYKIVKKPYLTNQQKNQRVKFAKSHIKWSVKQWQSCIFTDESSFETKMMTGGQRVRRLKGEVHRYTEKNTKRQLHFPQKVMMWASIGNKGIGKLVFLKKREMMNSRRYVQILQKVLPGEMEKHNAKHLIQDRAPSHTSKNTIQSMKDMKLSTIFIPGSSPDMNIIENCFGYLKTNLQYEDTSSIPKLKLAIRKLWNKIPRKFIDSLYQSMKRRMEAVIQHNGVSMG